MNTLLLDRKIKACLVAAGPCADTQLLVLNRTQYTTESTTVVPRGRTLRLHGDVTSRVEVLGRNPIIVRGHLIVENVTLSQFFLVEGGTLTLHNCTVRPIQEIVTMRTIRSIWVTSAGSLQAKKCTFEVRLIADDSSTLTLQQTIHNTGGMRCVQITNSSKFFAFNCRFSKTVDTASAEQLADEFTLFDYDYDMESSISSGTSEDEDFSLEDGDDEEVGEEDEDGEDDDDEDVDEDTSGVYEGNEESEGKVVEEEEELAEYAERMLDNGNQRGSVRDHRSGRSAQEESQREKEDDDQHCHLQDGALKRPLHQPMWGAMDCGPFVLHSGVQSRSHTSWAPPPPPPPPPPLSQLPASVPVPPPLSGFASNDGDSKLAGSQRSSAFCGLPCCYCLCSTPSSLPVDNCTSLVSLCQDSSNAGGEVKRIGELRSLLDLCRGVSPIGGENGFTSGWRSNMEGGGCHCGSSCTRLLVCGKASRSGCNPDPHTVQELLKGGLKGGAPPPSGRRKGVRNGRGLQLGGVRGGKVEAATPLIAQAQPEKQSLPPLQGSPLVKWGGYETLKAISDVLIHKEGSLTNMFLHLQMTNRLSGEENPFAGMLDEPMSDLSMDTAEVNEGGLNHCCPQDSGQPYNSSLQSNMKSRFGVDCLESERECVLLHNCAQGRMIRCYVSSDRGGVTVCGPLSQDIEIFRTNFVHCQRGAILSCMGANALVKRCCFRDVQACAIRCVSANAQVEENLLEDIHGCGVDLVHSNGVVLDNTFRNICAEEALTAPSGQGARGVGQSQSTALTNPSETPAGCVISVRDGGRPLLQNNFMFQGVVDGIRVSGEQTAPLVEGNTIISLQGNAFRLWNCHKDTSVVQNAIQRCTSGIVATDCSACTFSSNRIEDCSNPPIIVEGAGSRPLVLRNEISNTPQQFGIAIGEGVTASVAHNTVTTCKGGILMLGSGSLMHNRIDNCSETSICLDRSTDGCLVSGNDLQSNGLCVLVQGSSGIMLENNNISDSLEGVKVLQSHGITMSHCSISHCIEGGLYVDGSSSVAVELCLFAKNSRDAVVLESRAECLLSRCIMSGNEGAGVQIGERMQFVDIRGCHIHGNPVGMRLAANRLSKMEEAQIMDWRDWNVVEKNTHNLYSNCSLNGLFPQSKAEEREALDRVLESLEGPMMMSKGSQQQPSKSKKGRGGKKHKGASSSSSSGGGGGVSTDSQARGLSTLSGSTPATKSPLLPDPKFVGAAPFGDVPGGFREFYFTQFTGMERSHPQARSLLEHAREQRRVEQEQEREMMGTQGEMIPTSLSDLPGDTCIQLPNLLPPFVRVPLYCFSDAARDRSPLLPFLLVMQELGMLEGVPDFAAVELWEAFEMGHDDEDEGDEEEDDEAYNEVGGFHREGGSCIPHSGQRAHQDPMIGVDHLCVPEGVSSRPLGDPPLLPGQLPTQTLNMPAHQMCAASDCGSSSRSSTCCSWPDLFSLEEV